MGMRVLYPLTTSNLKNIPEEARWAESMGYDGLCTEETGHDPFLPLLLAASNTSRVTLETRVAIAFPRSPMVVAYTAMDLHGYSGGRFRLGLGTQVKGHIERRFSVKWGAPGPKLREYIQSLRAIWENWQEGTKLDFHGQFYSFTLMTPFFSPGASPDGTPPVFISALNPFNCRVAGEVCDGLALHPITSPKYLADVIKPNIGRGAETAGRSPADITLTGASFVATGPNQREIDAKKEAIKRQLAFYFSTRTYFPVLEVHGLQEVGQKLHQMSVRGEWSQMAEIVSDEMLETFAVVSPYDEVAARVKERFGGLLDETLLAMGTSSAGDQKQLRRIIDDLKS